ncbi:MAG TPA: efflux RND transporter periplasmic adaptor subunit [Candidatus Acidoferrum sp.]|nr:efflux RND transporter periplasmic adaptor subunit [Candidatus Acidoferrum sp.]
MSRTKIIVVLAVLAAGALAAWHWMDREPPDAAEEDSNGHEGSPAGLNVAVARAQRSDMGDTLNLAGAFKPFQDVDVHAKVAGYIRHIYVDVGDRVKEGQVLAVLEVPELAAQLAGAGAAVHAAEDQVRRAQSDVQRAQSMHAAAHSAYARLKQAADSRAGLVAQQEVDDSQAKDLEAEGQVASAEAALSAARRQLEVAQATQRQVSAMSDYTRILAPFAGVITSRSADTGALVSAGTTGGSQSVPVVRLAQISVLRLVLFIPESIAAQIQLGEVVDLHVQALDRDIQGKVARFADSLDMQTRTMETEIDVDNRNGQLIPGMYAEARLALRKKKNVLTIPLQAVVRNGDDATVLALTSQNIIEERHVRLGSEDSAYVEVASGVAEGDRVILGNRSLFRAGQKVQPHEVAPAAAIPGKEQ